MGTDTKGVGLKVDGLREAINALGKIDKQAKKEAIDVMRDASKKVQAMAQANIGKGLYRGPTPRGMIGRSATSAGAATKLRASRYPYALVAEYGEKTAHIPQRNGPSLPRRQSGFKRRTANPFRPPTNPSNLFKNNGGYMIQPAIKKLGPKVIREANDRMFDLINKTLKREMR